MRKRLLKPLIYLLVAAQLLLAVPAMAFSGTTSTGASHADHCPCCPDGADSMKDCLVSCTLAAVAAPAIQVSSCAALPPSRIDAPPSAPLYSIADPPLKPPPIR